MDSNYKELRRNTIIIAIANMGSKLIMFILAPLYSYYMNTAEYGTMDLISTTVGLLVPVLCLDIYEATFRFSSDKAYSEKKVLSSSIIICLPGIFICFCIPLLSNIIDFDGITLFAIAVSFALEAINLVIAQFLRGTNKMLQFAFSGIVASIGLLLANAYFLIILGWGLKGWILSFLISKIVCTIYLIVISNFKHMFSIQSVERAYVNQFLKFCIPLMPTATMWWIMNLSDRYMLAYFIGTAATGIYAVSNKIPSLLSVFETIFYQAWMTTAISTKDNSNRDEIYSNVFNNYLVILLIGVLGILLIGKPFVIILFENSYNNAYLYIPILIMGVVIHALNGNLGSLYSVFKNTKGALYSTAIGALTNVVLNCIFIPYIGIMGAAITTLIGYIVTLVYRWIDTKKFVSIVLEKKQIFLMTLIVILQAVLYYIPGTASYIIRTIIVLSVLWKYRKVLLSVLKK